MKIIHFFYDIRLAMYCDYNKALLSISIVIHMRIFNTLRIYLENLKSTNSIIFDAVKVADLLYYFESSSIIRDLTFYLILILVATIPIFTIVCYFIRKDDKQELPNYLKSLASFYTILCWTLQYPLEYQLIVYLLNQDNILLKILAGFGIAIYKICLSLFTYFISSDQYQKKDFLNINNKTALSLWFLLNIPIVLMNAYNFEQYKVLLYVISFFVQYAYEIYVKNVTLFGDYHINEFFIKSQGLFTSVLLALVLDNIFVDQLSGNSSITYFLIIILTLKNSLKTEIDFERMLKLNTFSYNELKLKIFYLEHIIDEGQHTVIYESLYFRHLNTKCQSHQLKQINKCFCNSPQIFYAKRQQDSSTSQNLLIKNRSIFYKFIIKIWFQDYLFNNPNHLQARLDYAKFLFYKLRASNDSLLQLRQIRSKNPIIRYQIITLHKTIEEFFYRNNQNSFSQNLDFQNVLELESQFCIIQTQIYQVLELRLKFWKLLTKDKIFYDDLMEIFEQIKSKIDDCQHHWKKVIQFKTTINNQITYVSKLDKRKRWRLLHCWYVQNIMYKKLTQSMMDHFSNSVIDIKNQFEDDQLTEDSDQDQDFQNLNDKISYTQHSMVFQTTGNQDCQILNTNNEAVALLGYSKNELRQLNISIMIPQIQQRNHQESLRQFYQTGRSRCLYKKCKVFCVNRKGILIKSSKYLKLIINPIMPIIKSQYQYIILNELWEVQALSRSLSSVITDIGFCFFLVCQKSLLFSQYIKYLRPSDIEKFGLQKKNSGTNIRDRDSDVNLRNTEIQINYQSMIFNDKPSKGLIQSYALIDDDQSVFVGNQDKLINVQDGELLVLKLRISKKHTQMVIDYKKRKINYPNLNLRNQRLIHYNDKNQIRFIKHRVFRQARLLKEILIQEHLDFLKQLQYEYLNDSHSIDRIFKIELKLKFDERRILDRGIILQIGRMDLIWTDKKTELTVRKAKKEQTQSFVNMISNMSGLNSPRFTNQYDDIDGQEYFLESNRNPLNSLISDEQMIIDFKSEQSLKFVINEKSLIIKEDNNKASKNFQRLQLLKILNRVFVSIQILIILVSFLVGFKQQYFNFVYNFGGFYTSQMFKITLTTIQTYSTAIDIVLFNANLTQDILLNSKLSQVGTKEEWYNQTHLELDDQFNYIMYELYGDPYFLKMFYGFSVSYSDEANVIDILDNFENNQVMLYSTPFEIIDDKSIIIMFFRHFMVPLWYKSTQLTIANLIDQSRLQLSLYRNIIVTILTFFIIFATFIFGITIVLQITLNSQVDTIYNQIFIIEPQYIDDQLKQEFKLMRCIIYIMEIMNNELDRNEEKYSPQSKNKKDYVNEDGQLKQKQKKVIGSQQLFKKKIRNLLIFIFSFFILITTPIIYFSDQYILSQMIEQMYLHNDFIYHIDHIWVLILGTEVYLSKYQNTQFVNQQNYIDALKNFQESMVNQDMFQSSIPSVQQLSLSEFCPDDLCKSYLNGVSQGGLRNYNLLLNQLLLGILNEDPRYEPPTLYRIYEFNLMQKYVFDVYLLQWALWTDEFEQLVISTVNQELSLVIISLLLSIFCFIGFFELLLFKRLNKKYINVRYFYKKFIPNDVVSNQKRIRAQLILCGLIKK